MFLGPYVGSPLVAVNSVCGKVPFGFMSVIYCFVPPSSATCTGMGNTDMKAVCCVICCVIGPIELHSVNFFCLTYVASITPGIIELSIPLPFFSLIFVRVHFRPAHSVHCPVVDEGVLAAGWPSSTTLHLQHAGRHFALRGVHRWQATYPLLSS